MSELPSGWAKTHLTDIIELHDSRRIPLNKEARQQRQGPYPYYGANGLVDHIDDFLFEGNFVLLAEDGGYFDEPARGVAYEASGKFWVNNHAHILSPRGGISNRFLKYVLNSISWLPYVGGSTRLKLTQAGMQQVPTPVPPLAEQRRIVAKIDSLLSRSSRARHELDHIPKLVERYKQSILAKAFSGELTADWRQTNTAPEPSEAHLSDIIATPIRNGLSVRGSDLPPGVRSLRLSALRRGLVDLTDVRYLPITDRIAERFYLLEGDILVSRGNGTKAFVGIAALVGPMLEPTIFPDTAFRIRLERSRALAKWFVSIWNAPQVRKQIEKAAKTTAGIWKVSQSDLARIGLLLPSRAEQQEIIHRIETAFAWLDKIALEHSRASHLLLKLDHAILAKAFRGELVPQDPNDEPASLLLERIKSERQSGERKKVRSSRG